MRKRMVLASLMVVCSGWVVGSGWAVGAPPEPHHPPLVSCRANPSSLKPGGLSTISVSATSPDSSPISSYTYAASAGTITGNGSTATLNPNGYRGAITITVVVTDARGLSGTCTTVVMVGAPYRAAPVEAPDVKSPPPPPPPPPEERPTRAPTPPATDVAAPAPAPETKPAPPAPPQSVGGGGGGGGAPAQHKRAHLDRSPAAAGDAAPAVAGDAAPAAGPGPADAEHVSGWFKQLKEGAIEYNVPKKMTWQQQSTVTVVIHGFAAPKTTSLPEPTGTGALKVSDRMKVQLLAPDNPDEFTIEKEPGTEDIKFVPMDSTTTWRWQVTPKYPRKGQKMTIQAWVLYPGEEEKVAEELPVYTASLDVDASVMSNAARGFWNDPGNWVKYMLPGGAGFIFLAGIVMWIRKKVKQRVSKSAS